MSRFVRNSDNTVTETAKRLVWSETLLKGKDVPFENAAAAVKALGPEWRFPTVDELAALVDRSRHGPAIDTDAFPDTQNDLYWTDTPWAGNPASVVWGVGFDLGDVNGGHRDYGCCVRAVRELPSGQ